MGISAPVPFLRCSREPAILFGTWRKMFENYLPDARKHTLLLHSLNNEGQLLFHTLPNTGTMFDDAMAALENLFVTKVTVVVARHVFRQRSQRAGQTTSVNRRF